MSDLGGAEKERATAEISNGDADLLQSDIHGESEKTEIRIEINRKSDGGADRDAIRREAEENSIIFDPTKGSLHTTSLATVAADPEAARRATLDFQQELLEGSAKRKGSKGSRGEFTQLAHLRGVISDDLLIQLEDVLDQAKPSQSGLQVPKEALNNLAKEIAQALDNTPTRSLLANGDLAARQMVVELIATSVRGEHAIEFAQKVTDEVVYELNPGSRRTPITPELGREQIAADRDNLLRGIRAEARTPEPATTTPLTAAPIETRAPQSTETSAPAEAPAADTDAALAKRQQALLDETRRAAEEMARSDFQSDPAKSANPEAVKKRLSEIAARYPEFGQEIEQLVVQAFKEGYEAKQKELYQTELNWFQRRYYELKSVVVGAWEGISGFVTSAAKATWDFVTDPETWKSVGRGIKKVWDFATDPETWKAVGRGIKSAWDFVTDPETWKAVGRGLKSAWDFVTNPETWQKAWNGLCTAAKWAWDVARDPTKLWEAGKAVVGFLKGVSDSIGLSDLVVGVYKLGEAAVRTAVIAPVMALYKCGKEFGRLCTGQISFDEFAENCTTAFKDEYKKAGAAAVEGLRAIKGAVFLLGEVTGITDLVMCVKYTIEGNYAMAAMHGAFALASWTAIAATVVTAGAAVGSVAAVTAGRITVMQALKNVGSVALKQAAKRGLLKLGEEIGETVLEKTVKELGEEAFKSLSKEAVQELEKRALMEIGQKVLGEAAQQIFEKGGLVLIRDAVVEKIGEKGLRELLVKKLGEEIFQKMLKEAAEKGVEQSAHELARNIAEKGRDALATDSLKKVTKKAGHDVTMDLLEELGTGKKVKEEVLQLLEELHGRGLMDRLTGGSFGRVQKLLEKHGMEEGEAKIATRALRKAVRGARSDGEMAEILTRGITDVISSELQAGMEKPFKEAFELAIRGELKTEGGRALRESLEGLARKEGKELSELFSEKEIRRMVDDAWDGFKDGIREAVEKVVRKAVKEAFDEFRKRHRHHLHSGNSKIKKLEIGEHEIADAPPPTFELKAKGPEYNKYMKTSRSGKKAFGQKLSAQAEEDAAPLLAEVAERDHETIVLGQAVRSSVKEAIKEDEPPTNEESTKNKNRSA